MGMVSSCRQPQTLQQHPSWIPLSGTQTLVNRPFIKVSLLLHLFRLFPPDILIDPINKHHLACFSLPGGTSSHNKVQGGGEQGAKEIIPSCLCKKQEISAKCLTLHHSPQLPLVVVSHIYSQIPRKRKKKKRVGDKRTWGYFTGKCDPRNQE